MSVLTRDPESRRSQALLSEFPNVKLLPGSYATETGLRTALKDQDVVYFNIDSFNIGEPFEYFWTFRAYEVALQSGLRLFIYPGASDRFGNHRMAEKYRNSHNIVASRLAKWFEAQPLDCLPWVILHGGVYAEMLNWLLKPRPHGDGFAFKVPMDHESIMPLLPLDNYGKCVEWILRNPQESIGKSVSAVPFEVTFPDIAAAFQEVSGKEVEFVPVSIDDWMTSISVIRNPDGPLPRTANPDDPTVFTFRKSFSAWWNLWKDNRRDAEEGFVIWKEDEHASRPKTLQEWMRSVGYNPT